ncbi:pyroglutamyl-peptidase I [Guptibacillus hwajinpoensis]|uniref:Pyroglutamyl-peptidase I n=1 Tax=Guptibacillus hwajinpoensis TaxID=208199 RepID=A0A0J6CUN3_9BACL|nr:pyroglutamyl-peptidase I [Alkalihalobacillus macyae]KMM36908.1 peptidase C15 [Alkalihalobacillus macyae]
MSKLLLTGFEPFLENRHNPTEQIVLELDEEVVGEFEVISRVLPVDFERAAEMLIEYVDQCEPAAIMMLGLAADRTKVTPERIAINVNDSVEDNSGNAPVDQPIVKGGPAAYFSTLPIKKMTDALVENGIPAEVSNTAGTYLCNNVMYSVLYALEQKEMDIPAGFIHVPPTFEMTLHHSAHTGFPYTSIRDSIKLMIYALSDD